MGARGPKGSEWNVLYQPGRRILVTKKCLNCKCTMKTSKTAKTLDGVPPISLTLLLNDTKKKYFWKSWLPDWSQIFKKSAPNFHIWKKVKFCFLKKYREKRRRRRKKIKSKNKINNFKLRQSGCESRVSSHQGSH